MDKRIDWLEKAAVAFIDQLPRHDKELAMRFLVEYRKDATLPQHMGLVQYLRSQEIGGTSG